MVAEFVQSRRNGVIRNPDGTLSFRVWAPFANRVELTFRDEKLPAIDMQSTDRGLFECTVSDALSTSQYKFRLDGRASYPDPCSLHQPQGVHGHSAPFYPQNFEWTDHRWSGHSVGDLVFYETHVGTFTREGTFDAIIERLPELRSLGITALELMPIAQFPGTRNWGYDGVNLFAAHSGYGGPAGLQRLIDAAHRNDLAIFLDVVYNHLGPEGNYLSQFGPYFTDRYKTPWGEAVNYDGRDSDGVRHHILSNARMWLEEFHVDGLRLDAVHAIFDFSATHILSEIAAIARAVERNQNRQIQIVAESDLNDPRLLKPVERGGYAIDAQWCDDFHHVAHVHFTGETAGYYCDFDQPEHVVQTFQKPFIYTGQYSRFRGRKHGAPANDLSDNQFIVYLQNHDQIGNRVRGDRLATILAPAKQRQAAAWLLLSPYLPLIFMGEEYGELNPFKFFCSFDDQDLIESIRAGRRKEFAEFKWSGHVPDPQSIETFESCRLNWEWPDGSPAARLRKLYHDLLAARRIWPALRGTNRNCEIVQSDSGGRILRLVRFGDEREHIVEAFFNLEEERVSYPVPLEPARRVLLSTEDIRYGGRREVVENPDALLAWECLVVGSSQRFE